MNPIIHPIIFQSDYYRNFELIEELDASSLEERYFKNQEGELVARVNGTHSIVLARISDLEP